MEAKVAVTLDLDLLCPTTLSVLHGCTASSTCSPLSADVATIHDILERQLGIVLICGDLHIRDREVSALARYLRAISIIIGSLSHDSFSLKLSPSGQTALSRRYAERVLAVKAREVHPVKVSHVASGHIPEVPATRLIAGALVICVVRR